MNHVAISPSVLGYEPDLEANIGKILEINAAGASVLHIDVMDEDFAGREAFDVGKIQRLYEALKSTPRFDIHLMVSNPHTVYGFVSTFILSETSRARTTITIHREAYRPQMSMSINGIGVYTDKEFDLLTYDTKNNLCNRMLRTANEMSGAHVLDALREIKEKGFSAGLALEPGTSLGNITKEMYGLLDKVLLMTVPSGAGGQDYMHEVTPKIAALRRMKPGLAIQVDGGINSKTIEEALKAGATNLVIGPDITNSEKPGERLREIKQQVIRLGYQVQ